MTENKNKKIKKKMSIEYKQINTSKEMKKYGNTEEEKHISSLMEGMNTTDHLGQIITCHTLFYYSHIVQK
jgi:hypothetical protein